MDPTPVNPYAPPVAEIEKAPRADREIRDVILGLRFFGWIGTILYVVMTIGPLVILVYSFFAEFRDPPIVLVGASLFNGMILAIFISYLRVASRLKRREPSALRWAVRLSYLMMIGFPLFTIVGVLCLRKLKRYYEEYCQAPTA